MDSRKGMVATTASLAAWIVLLLGTTAAGQAAPARPLFPAPPEGCRVWEAHVLYVIEQHRREGTSETALGEALNIAYAKYAQCVMGGCDLNGEDAVAALDHMHLVLSGGRAVALVDP